MFETKNHLNSNVQFNKFNNFIHEDLEFILLELYAFLSFLKRKEKKLTFVVLLKTVFDLYIQMVSADWTFMTLSIN